MHVIALHQGDIRDKISRFKHGHGIPVRYALGWARVFGRLIVGYLDDHNELAEQYDLITPNPTFLEPGEPQHTELTIDAARDEASLHDWPFDEAPWAMTKNYATPGSTGGTWRQKFDSAKDHAAALSVDRSAVDGRRILLYDDVFTTGSQFHTVGNLLLAHGALSVDGLVLARRPWVR